MKVKKRGQISVEYLIITGFVMVAVIGILGIGLLYSASIKDKVRLNQLSAFANKIIQSSESVFYAGEPSQVTFLAYLPAGIRTINVTSSELIFSIDTTTGRDTLAFSSNVPLSGTLATHEGMQRIRVKAFADGVVLGPV